MSHFTVSVITDGVPDPVLAATLQPWHEFECTGTDDQYIQEIDKTEEYRAEYASQARDKSFLDWVQAWSGSSPLWPGQKRELFQTHKYGFVEVGPDGNVVRVVKRTNPNAKWDGWVVGGRWKDSLLTKAGEKVDSCPLEAIDLAAMRAEKREAAIELWTRYHKVVAGRTVPIWEEVREKYHGNIDAARDEYHSYQVIHDLKEANLDGWHISEDDISALPRLSVHEYCALKESTVLVTFALLKGGVWHERGEMGWFACVSKEKKQDDWNAEFHRLLADVPGTSWLTVVDCHI